MNYLLSVYRSVQWVSSNPILSLAPILLIPTLFSFSHFIYLHLIIFFKDETFLQLTSMKKAPEKALGTQKYIIQ